LPETGETITIFLNSVLSSGLPWFSELLDHVEAALSLPVITA
jgi:hypothetical protein